MREAERTAEQAAVIDHNRRAWDRLAAEGVPLARPAADEAFGDPRGWLGSAGTAARPWLPVRLDGLDVLCLAGGGGNNATATHLAVLGPMRTINTPSVYCHDKRFWCIDILN